MGQVGEILLGKDEILLDLLGTFKHISHTPTVCFVHEMLLVEEHMFFTTSGEDIIKVITDTIV